jgi:hypothetical protein
LYPIEQLADSCAEKVNAGAALLQRSKVAIVGLARNCGQSLQANLDRALDLATECKDFAIHVEENDSTDTTKQVLLDYCKHHSNITATMQTFGRKQRGNEFAGPRTKELAEYRSACQSWVRDCADDSDYVIVLDWDQRGGWSQFGVLNGFGFMALMPDACGMASVSLLESDIVRSGGGKVEKVRGWLHYDAWALRLNSWIDDYCIGRGAWKHQWVPLVGTDPVHVRSAFGGLCIYRTQDYLAGTYSGEDCEHVTFHRTIVERTGRTLYLNPTQRCVMQWLEDTDGGRDCDNLHPDVP